MYSWVDCRLDALTSRGNPEFSASTMGGAFFVACAVVLLSRLSCLSLYDRAASMLCKAGL